MTISYKWLSEYLPVTVDPERLSRILTSIGLEVENMTDYEEVKGGLRGLVIGEVLTTEKHPNADKLTVTTVNTGSGSPLQIVCGAPNVAAGQKVVVAPVGTTIYPTTGDPLTMKVAKIRSVESFGMICAEDEIGLGDSHAGIMVLPSEARIGQPAAEYFQPYSDTIYEIGLTPNRMDAMSHWGVARDVCAYLSHHDKKELRPRYPNGNGFRTDDTSLNITVKIEDAAACPRYSGVSISNIKVGPSPAWLQQKLRAIGIRTINNIVDITNFIQHETGQPLHAFDAAAIEGNEIVVKSLPEGTSFITLDEKERKLSAEDLMICNSREGMCIAGVFGGAKSGVTEKTTNIFLESACFDPVSIRKTSFRHGLRTDAATRFEKGTDISATVNVLRRAAVLIKEVCGGTISSNIIDIYPEPLDKPEVAIKYHYLKKLSGKNYHPDAVKTILNALGFDILKEGIDELRLAVPYHKRDISLPADLVEEVLRIDGLDNVDIPNAIMITPAIELDGGQELLREKTANYLAGLGFNEIMTNSITNAAYFTEETKATGVMMLNSLSAELNIMRPSMLETGLEAVSHNLNRKNSDLRLFEFGKTYHSEAPGMYHEPVHLCLYLTGNAQDNGWRVKSAPNDFYILKGIVGRILQLTGIKDVQTEVNDEKITGKIKGEVLFTASQVSKAKLAQFDIKQDVYFADFNWDLIVKIAAKTKLMINEIPRFPAVQRDLAVVVDSTTEYGQLQQAVNGLRLSKLQSVSLFDVFESEKLGKGKKSLAVNFVFQDAEKTLTDKEIDGWMGKIMSTLEKEVSAEIRK